MDRNLLEVLEEKPDGLDRDQVRFFIYQLLKACDYFHQQNVMHRDIKPENILLDNQQDLYIKLTDFGFSSYFKEQESFNDQLGSPLYMPPEIVSN